MSGNTVLHAISSEPCPPLTEYLGTAHGGCVAICTGEFVTQHGMQPCPSAAHRREYSNLVVALLKIRMCHPLARVGQG
jgi:hypothetical protein